MRSSLCFLILAAALGAAAPASADPLAADKDRLQNCVAEAFPEGDLPVSAAQEKPVAASNRGCIGLIARANETTCAASTDCVERETKAWLALALDLNREPLTGRNRAAVVSAVAGIERQARATCMAAAALSAWGRDQVAKGKQRIGLDHPCMRDAVAGLVMPLLGYLRGI